MRGHGWSGWPDKLLWLQKRGFIKEYLALKDDEKSEWLLNVANTMKRRGLYSPTTYIPDIVKGLRYHLDKEVEELLSKPTPNCRCVNNIVDSWIGERDEFAGFVVSGFQAATRWTLSMECAIEFTRFMMTNRKRLLQLLSSDTLYDRLRHR